MSPPASSYYKVRILLHHEADASLHFQVFPFRLPAAVCYGFISYHLAYFYIRCSRSDKMIRKTVFSPVSVIERVFPAKSTKRPAPEDWILDCLEFAIRAAAKELALESLNSALFLSISIIVSKRFVLSSLSFLQWIRIKSKVWRWKESKISFSVRFLYMVSS